MSNISQVGRNEILKCHVNDFINVLFDGNILKERIDYLHDRTPETVFIEKIMSMVNNYSTDKDGAIVSFVNFCHLFQEFIDVMGTTYKKTNKHVPYTYAFTPPRKEFLQLLDKKDLEKVANKLMSISERNVYCDAVEIIEGLQ